MYLRRGIWNGKSTHTHLHTQSRCVQKIILFRIFLFICLPVARCIYVLAYIANSYARDHVDSVKLLLLLLFSVPRRLLLKKPIQACNTCHTRNYNDRNHIFHYFFFLFVLPVKWVISKITHN